MRVKSSIYQCRFDCSRCADGVESEGIEEEEFEVGTSKKRQNHCHCPLWKPSSELIGSMNGGQPSRRFKQKMKRKREQLEAEILELGVEEE